MSGLKGCELESCNESVVNERCALFTPYTSRKNWLWKERLGTRICSSAPTHHFNKQQTKKYIEGRSLRMREFHRFRLREEEILRRRTFYGKMQHITTWIFKQLILCDKVMAISCRLIIVTRRHISVARTELVKKIPQKKSTFDWWNYTPKMLVFFLNKLKICIPSS